MTDQHSHDETTPDPHFNKAELAQFDRDDTDAGRAIGKMLSLFFLYTVIVMSICAWWTWVWQTSQH